MPLAEPAGKPCASPSRFSWLLWTSPPLPGRTLRALRQSLPSRVRHVDWQKRMGHPPPEWFLASATPRPRAGIDWERPPKQQLRHFRRRTCPLAAPLSGFHRPGGVASRPPSVSHWRRRRRHHPSGKPPGRSPIPHPEGPCWRRARHTCLSRRRSSRVATYLRPPLYLPRGPGASASHLAPVGGGMFPNELHCHSCNDGYGAPCVTRRVGLRDTPWD